jgi:hypothetical protein
MPPDNALTSFLRTYSRARNDAQRLQAIRQFRDSSAVAAAAPEGAVVVPVLVALLRRLSRDGREARVAAAALLRDLWCRAAPTVAEETYARFTRRLLKTSLLLASEERAVLLAAMEDGCAASTPSVVGRLCLAVIEEEVQRCLHLCVGRPFASPSAPTFDVLRFVVRCAPVAVWPRLVCDVWRLYNLDTDPVGLLTLPEMFARRRSETAFRERRTRHGRSGVTFGGAFRPVLRRDRDGRLVSLETCWDTAQTLLLRTLTESRPEDLGSAAPGFFAWLEDLVRLKEEDRRSFLTALRGWAVPAMIPVLERWRSMPTLPESLLGALTPSPAFREEVFVVLAEMRASLGLSPEVVPAMAPHGNESEPAPAAPDGDGDGAGSAAHRER